MTKIIANINQEYTPLAPIDMALVKQLRKEKIYAYELELRLREWGQWRAKEVDGAVGYPSTSSTELAMMGGRKTGGSVVLSNPRAEQVHQAFLLMKTKHLEWAQVLDAEYVRSALQIEADGDNSRNDNQSARAARMGIKGATYRWILKSAKAFVEAKIS